VNTIGIGSSQGVPLFDETTGQIKRDNEGNAVISKLNEAELQQLAQQTKGIYVHLADAEDAADKVIRQLETISEMTVSDTTYTSYTNYFGWLLAPALILLLADLFIPERKKIKLV